MSVNILDIPRERKAFRPYGASRTMWQSRRREVLMCGPGDTGKSRAILEKLHYCANKYPHSRLLMVRKTRKSLTQTAMVTYEQKVLPDGWLGSLIRFNTTDQQYEYPNGSIIAVAGMDDPSKVLSSEWDMIYCQEATELDENSWEYLTMRLRNSVMPYQQLVADCNPSYPTHWLKQRCDRGATLYLESRHADNPSFTPERRAVLEALTGVRSLRLWKGLWAAATGLVYENYDPFVHILSLKQLVEWHILRADRSIDPVGTRRVLATVDWGFANPGVITVHAIDSDNRSYQIHEVYKTRETVDKYWVPKAIELKKKYGIEQFICDPAQPAYIEQFNRAGCNAVGATNDIIPGINAMQSRLTVQPDGRARFYLYADALESRDEARADAKQPCCTADEILEYVWPKAADGKPLKEVPVDDNNHGLDTCRYLCMALEGPSAATMIAAVKARADRQKQQPPTVPLSRPYWQ